MYFTHKGPVMRKRFLVNLILDIMRFEILQRIITAMEYVWSFFIEDDIMQHNITNPLLHEVHSFHDKKCAATKLYIGTAVTCLLDTDQFY